MYIFPILLIVLFISLFIYSNYKIYKTNEPDWIFGILIGVFGTLATCAASDCARANSKDFPISYTEEHISNTVFVHAQVGNFSKTSKEDYDYFLDHKPALIRKHYNYFGREINQELIKIYE